MSLLTSFLHVLLVCMVIFVIIYIVWKSIFQCKGYRMEGIIYNSQELIVQCLKRGTSNTVIVMGNGWNVSINKNSRITKHDPVFLIPKKELELLKEGKEDYNIITAYFPFECSGIDNSAAELAYFLNKYYYGYNIILLGHSKSAVQFAQVLNYLDGRNLKLIFVSPAFGGVISNEEVISTLGMLDRILYRLIFVPHKVNEDITKGSFFLREIADFSKISEYEAYLFRSKVWKKPFNIINNYLLHMDRKLGILGDGIIGYKEQYCDVKWTRKFIVYASHSDSMAVAIQELEDISVL